MKHHTASEDRVRILFVFVSARMVGKNLNTPNWSSMADDTITQGGIGALGSPLYLSERFQFPSPSLSLHITLAYTHWQLVAITCFGFSGNELSSGHTLLLSSILLSITPLVPFSTSGVQSGQRTSLPLYVTFSPGAIVTLSKNQKKSCVNSYHYYVLYQNFFLNSTS